MSIYWARKKGKFTYITTQNEEEQILHKVAGLGVAKIVYAFHNMPQ